MVSWYLIKIDSKNLKKCKYVIFYLNSEYYVFIIYSVKGIRG